MQLVSETALMFGRIRHIINTNRVRPDCSNGMLMVLLWQRPTLQHSKKKLHKTDFIFSEKFDSF